MTQKREKKRNLTKARVPSIYVHHERPHPHVRVCAEKKEGQRVGYIERPVTHTATHTYGYFLSPVAPRESIPPHPAHFLFLFFFRCRDLFIIYSVELATSIVREVMLLGVSRTELVFFFFFFLQLFWALGIFFQLQSHYSTWRKRIFRTDGSKRFPLRFFNSFSPAGEKKSVWISLLAESLAI